MERRNHPRLDEPQHFLGRLAALVHSAYWPAFLPDGESVVVHEHRGRSGESPRPIVRIPTSGGEPITISDGPTDDGPVVHPTLPRIVWQRRDHAGTVIVTRSPEGVETVLPERGSDAIFWP